MPKHFYRLALALFASQLIGVGWAQEAEIPREHHPWGHFAPGAWKCVRVITETFGNDEQPTSVSVTDSTTTLTHADHEGFTLRVESTVEMAGKRIVAEPQITTQRYNGALPGQTAQIALLGSDQVRIDGMQFPCQVRQVEVGGAVSKTTSKIFYCGAVAPYVLRRESHSTDLPTNTRTNSSKLEVIALDMPYIVMGQIKSVAYVKATQEHEKGTSVTVAVSAVDVPGWVVANTSTERDSSDRRIRRSTLELVDYGLRRGHAESHPPRRFRLFGKPMLFPDD